MPSIAKRIFTHASLSADHGRKHQDQLRQAPEVTLEVIIGKPLAAMVTLFSISCGYRSLFRAGGCSATPENDRRPSGARHRQGRPREVELDDRLPIFQSQD